MQWLDVVEDLKREVLPLLAPADQAFAENLDQEPSAFAAVVLSSAAESGLKVRRTLLRAVESVLLGDATGHDRADITRAIANLRSPRAA